MSARLVSGFAVCLALLLAVGCGLPNTGETETLTRTDTGTVAESSPGVGTGDLLTDRPSSVSRETDEAPTAPHETVGGATSDSETDTAFVKPTETDAPETDRVTSAVTDAEKDERETPTPDREPSKPTETETKTETETDAPARTSFTVRFDPNGGSLTEETMPVTYGASYRLPRPMRIGYEFVGWQYGDTMLEQSGIWQIAVDVTLVAAWRKT